MQDTVKLRCPKCSGVISVPQCDGLENKTIKCGHCKSLSLYSQFAKIGLQNPEAETTTIIHKAEGNQALGVLKLMESHEGPYQLKPGINIIGRKASTSKADIQIPTGDKRRMSREHLIIEVKGDDKKGYAYHLRLYKEQVGVTKISKTQLFFGDCVALKSGDVISMPDAEVMFEIPNDDATETNL